MRKNRRPRPEPVEPEEAREPEPELEPPASIPTSPGPETVWGPPPALSAPEAEDTSAGPETVWGPPPEPPAPEEPVREEREARRGAATVWDTATKGLTAGEGGPSVTTVEKVLQAALGLEPTNRRIGAIEEMLSVIREESAAEAAAVRKALEEVSELLPETRQLMDGRLREFEEGLGARLDLLEARVAEAMPIVETLAGDLDRRLTSETDVHGRLGELADSSGSLHAKVDEVGEQVTGRVGELTDQVTGRVGELTDQVTGRVGELTDQVTGRLDQLSEHVTGRMEEQAAAIRDQLGDHRDSQTARFEGLTKELDSAIRGHGEDQTAKMTELARGTLARLRGLHQSFEQTRTTLEEQMERRLALLPGELEEVLGARLRSSVEAVQDRTSGALVGLRSAVEGLEQRLTAMSESTQARMGSAFTQLAGPLRQVEGHLETMATDLDASLRAGLVALTGSIRDQVETGVVALRREVEALRTLPEISSKLQEDFRELKAEVQQSAGAVTQVNDALGSARRDFVEVGQRIAGEVQAIHQGFERVDALAVVIESLGRRRGFHEVVENDKRVLEEQARLVEQMTSASATLAHRVESLEQRLQGLVELATGQQQADRLAAVSRDLRESVKEQRGMEQAVTGLRSEVEQLRNRMETWGKGMGQEAERLVETVVKPLRELVDQRFESLVRLMDARGVRRGPPQPSGGDGGSAPTAPGS